MNQICQRVISQSVMVASKCAAIASVYHTGHDTSTTDSLTGLPNNDASVELGLLTLACQASENDDECHVASVPPFEAPVFSKFKLSSS